MRKFYLFLLLVLLQQFFSFSQAKEIRGRILNAETRKAYSGLKVRLSVLSDSVQYETITNYNGYFNFQFIPESIDSVFICTGEGYEFCQNLNLNKQFNKAPRMYLSPQMVSKDSLVHISFLQGNQLRYIANGFVTNSNSVLHNLILKIPSVTQYDNTIYTQGETLQEVMIDFWIYFNDNNNVVLDNFPVDFVDTIKVYDDISTDMFANGFDDDDAAKAIDFIPKKSYYKSLFGTAYAGLGSDNRYNMGANINYFNNNQHLHIVQQTNNVNRTLYSPNNITNTAGDNYLNSFEDRANNPSLENFIGNISDFSIDQSKGLNDNNIFGISYFDKVGKISFFGNYFFNETYNSTESNLLRSYFSKSNGSDNYEEKSSSNSVNRNHRFRAKMYYFTDHLSSLRISPKVYLQETEGILLNEATIGSATESKSKSINQSNINMSANKFLIETNYLKAFDKHKKKTLTLDFTPTFFQKKGAWTLLSNLLLNDLPNVDTLHSHTNYTQNLVSLKGDVIYTQPINNRFRLLFGYYFAGQMAKTNKDLQFLVNDFNIDTNDFSSNLQSSYFNNSLKLMAQFTGKYWRLNPGFTYLNTIEKNESVFLNKDNSNVYNYFLPAVYFFYSKDHFTYLTVNYKSYTEWPTVEQLQNVVDMVNPINFSIGNLDLKPSTNNSLKVRYTQMLNNERNQLNLFWSVLHTNNSIGIQSNDNSFVKSKNSNDSTAIYINKLVNLDNYFNAKFSIQYASHILPLQSNISVNLFSKYYHVPTMNTDAVFFSNQSASGILLSLSSDITDRIDFLFSSTTSYNYTKSTLEKSTASKYVDQRTFLQFNFLLFNSLIISSEILHKYNFTDLEDFKENSLLLNAYLGYKFLKEKSLECRFSVYNILNQNKSAHHSVTDYYVEDLQTNNLERYFMISLHYKLNRPNL